MNCLNSSLSKGGVIAKAIAKAEVEVYDIVRVDVRVPMLSIKAAPANSTLAMGERFQKGLQ